MTVEQILKSGDKKKIKELKNAFDKMRQRDLDGKMMVLRTYYVCQIICVLFVCVMILWKY